MSIFSEFSLNKKGQKTIKANEIKETYKILYLSPVAYVNKPNINGQQGKEIFGVTCSHSTTTCRKMCWAFSWKACNLKRNFAWPCNAQAINANTILYLTHPEAFWMLAIHEMIADVQKGKGLIIRLNGTGECNPFWNPKGIEFVQTAKSLGVKLYSYTKNPGMIQDAKDHGMIPDPIEFLFSCAVPYEDWDDPMDFSDRNNFLTSQMMLRMGQNVAIIFRNEVPKQIKIDGVRHTVLDCSDDDFKWLSHQRGIVIGLKKQ